MQRIALVLALATGCAGTQHGHSSSNEDTLGLGIIVPVILAAGLGVAIYASQHKPPGDIHDLAQPTIPPPEQPGSRFAQ